MLNIYNECKEQPLMGKNYSAHKITRAEVEKPWPR